jgi:hypothetical protein
MSLRKRVSFPTFGSSTFSGRVLPAPDGSTNLQQLTCYHGMFTGLLTSS